MLDANTNIKIFIAGDSTAANYAQDKSPMAGWGQRIGHFFQASVTIRNEARNGKSSKSFLEEGHLNRIEEAIGVHDYLLIQFGHNDEKSDEKQHTEPNTTYREYLSRYIELARRKGANPILLTSVERRIFDATGKLIPSHGDYPNAVRKLAEEQQVPLLDICSQTQTMYRTMGPDASKSWFVWLEPNEHPNYPEGAHDNTHFNETGAYEVAKLIAGLIRKSSIPLLRLLDAERLLDC